MAETLNPYWNVPPKPQMKMAAMTTGQSSCRSEEHLRQRFPSLTPPPLKYVSVNNNWAGSAGCPSRGAEVSPTSSARYWSIVPSALNSSPSGSTKSSVYSLNSPLTSVLEYLTHGNLQPVAAKAS